MYGIGQRLAAWLIDSGWPEDHLRAVSAVLRAFQCQVVKAYPHAIYTVDTSRVGWATYRSTEPEELQRQLDLSEQALGETVSLWTDGSGNLAGGPAGIGVVVDWPGRIVRELSEYVGKGTNNFAELTAIRRGLECVLCRETPIIVRTDSSYCQTVILNTRCELRVNAALIQMIRLDCFFRSAVRIELVKGHSGVEGNERADKLAGTGRRKGMDPQPAGRKIVAEKYHRDFQVGSEDAGRAYRRADRQASR